MDQPLSLLTLTVSTEIRLSHQRYFITTLNLIKLKLEGSNILRPTTPMQTSTTDTILHLGMSYVTKEISYIHFIYCLHLCLYVHSSE
jgi:hypothetical protein